MARGRGQPDAAEAQVLTGGRDHAERARSARARAISACGRLASSGRG
jgi:hypothetical protein